MNDSKKVKEGAVICALTFIGDEIDDPIRSHFAAKSYNIYKSGLKVNVISMVSEFPTEQIVKKFKSIMDAKYADTGVCYVPICNDRSLRHVCDELSVIPSELMYSAITNIHAN